MPKDGRSCIPAGTAPLRTLPNHTDALSGAVDAIPF